MENKTSFKKGAIISLDQNTLKALDFFTKNKPPKLDLKNYKIPFVVGSGNAYNTGLLLFAGKAAVFADESNFRTVVKSYASVIKKGLVSQAVIISASGRKDSVWEIKLARKYGLKTTLLTCVTGSPAAEVADKILAFRKIAEPYTYNVSTYLGMILAATGENPARIKSFIKKVKLPKKFSNYAAYAFILPDKFLNICPMVEIKKSELFGPHLSLRCFSQGHARHAKFVVRSKSELVISFGEKNRYFGDPECRWDIGLPAWAGSATVLALAYFLVGKIQAAKPDYFKDNIERYCSDDGPRAYGKKGKFEVIVPGN